MRFKAHNNKLFLDSDLDFISSRMEQRLKFIMASNTGPKKSLHFWDERLCSYHFKTFRDHCRKELLRCSLALSKLLSDSSQVITEQVISAWTLITRLMVSEENQSAARPSLKESVSQSAAVKSHWNLPLCHKPIESCEHFLNTQQVKRRPTLTVQLKHTWKMAVETVVLVLLPVKPTAAPLFSRVWCCHSHVAA